jgi:flagellar hook-length control protein FliK
MGFLDAIIQQMQSGGTAQNATAGLGTLAEKISSLLQKSGVTQSDIQSMPPQDLAAKIQNVLQQNNISIPSSLQNLSSNDLATQLASLLQQNGSTAQSGLTNGLTSDLTATDTSSLDALQGETKEDVAKKITSMMDQQQQTGVAFTPAQFQQLQGDFKQLQSAPGTVDAATMSQMTSDLSTYLSGQGVSQSSISGFLADLTQSLQTGQSAPATTAAATSINASTPATSTDDASDTTDASAQDATSSSSATGGADITGFTQDTAQSFWQKNFDAQSNKTPILGKQSQAQAANADDDGSAHDSSFASQQVQNSLSSQSSLTSKISGPTVNAALINDIANGDSSGSGAGFGSGSGSQNGNGQQSQAVSGASNVLQPMTADMVQTQNFTNYMNTASASAPSAASTTTQQVAVQIQNNLSNGVNSMTIQLEPMDLGKMNVKLSFAKDGTVKAHMTVEKPETLALLQKDSSHLQKALQQSGLTTDENSLSFDLKQQSQQQNMQGFNGGNNNNSDEFDTHMDGNVSSALQAQLAIQSSGYITQSGVNIMV